MDGSMAGGRSWDISAEKKILKRGKRGDVWGNFARVLSGRARRIKIMFELSLLDIYHSIILKGKREIWQRKGVS